MESKDIWSLTIGVFGIIVGVIVTLLVTAWGNRASKKIAEKSGAFRKATITVRLFGEQLHSESTDESWLLLHPGKESDLGIFPLEFIIENTGDAPLEDAVFTLQAPKHCVPTEKDGISCESSVVPGVLSDSIKSSTVDIGNFRQVSVLLPRVSPKSAMGLTLPFSFTPTLPLTGATNVSSSDGMQFRMHYAAYIFNQFTLNLLTSEMPLQRGFRMAAIAAPDSKEALTQYESFLHDQPDRRLAKLSSKEKEKFMGSPGNLSHTIRVITFEVQKKHKVNEGAIYEMKADGVQVVKKNVLVGIARQLFLAKES